MKLKLKYCLMIFGMFKNPEKFNNKALKTRMCTFIAIVLCFVLIIGCNTNPKKNTKEYPGQVSQSEEHSETNLSSELESTNNLLIGKFRFVFVENQVILPYFVNGSEAFFLRAKEDTKYMNIDKMAAGNGIGYWGKMLHSESIYRVHGTSSDDLPEELNLISLNTHHYTIDSLELVESGKGICSVYVGILVPPTNDSDGFSPILPNSVKNNKGVFVQDGSITCEVVMANVENKQQLVNSFIGNEPININKQAPWTIYKPE